ncbi:MAG: ABC transporter permease, partial [Anaerolineae bacterium]
MLGYVVRRLALAVVTIIAISILSFIIIQLPPGDFVTTYIATMSAGGATVSEAEVEALREQYGLNQPMVVQYLKWAGQMLRGNFGMAMEWNRPVKDV